MKNKKKNIKVTNKDKNGFTLVELLAVIVVLALLVLIAGRAVTGQITKARKNTFRTETIEFAKVMSSNFDMLEIEENLTEEDFTVGSDTKTYKYACKTIEALKSSGDIEFSGANYKGYIEVFRENSAAGSTDVKEKIVRVNITNGTYAYYSKTLSEIAADKNFTTQESLGVDVTNDCPTTVANPDLPDPE